MKAAELKAWRASHGVTQVALADLLGITKQTIQNWEYAQVAPPFMLNLALERLAQLIEERQGDIDAVSREQLAREVLGYV